MDQVKGDAMKDIGAHPATDAPEHIAMNNITNSNIKAFCSHCDVLGNIPHCDVCWYSNFLQGNTNLLFVGM